MSTKQLIFLFLLGLVKSLTFSASAMQVSQGELITIENFPSKLVPPRAIHIWLPNNYSLANKYSVIYMHDGQMLFDAKTTWNNQEWRVDEVAQNLQGSKQVTPFIVVGINNLGSAQRYSEYTPQKPFLALTKEQQQSWYQQIRERQHSKQVDKVRSDQYLKFIVTELKPYIDKNYAVMSDKHHTFIMGSSMGGLISMYALGEYPNVFGAAACLSTHWPAGNEKSPQPLTKNIFSYLQEQFSAAKQQRIYFDHGDKTLDAYYPPLQKQVDKIFNNKGYDANNFNSEFFQGAAHDEKSWSERLDTPLLFLLAN